MEGGWNRRYSGSVLLHGSATVRKRSSRHSSSPAQNKTASQRCDARQNGRLKRLKIFMNKCFPCTRKKSKCDSTEEASSSEAVDGNQTVSVIHACSQSCDQDEYYRYLIQNTGRSMYFKDVVFSGEINVKVRKPSEEEDTSRVADEGRPNETLIQQQNDISPDDSKTEEKEVPACHSCGLLSDDTSRKSATMNWGLSVDSEQMDSLSEQHTAKRTASTDDGGNTQRKLMDTDLQEAGSHLAEDVKNAVRGLSVDTFGRPDGPLSKLPLRERSLYLHLPKLRRLQPKDLLAFRFPPSLYQEPQIQMMNSAAEFCHPRYADIEARSTSLRDCPELQLSGYGREELAQAGWFFNGHTLRTFCCGMEMPCSAQGHPRDVHLGASSCCGFALNLQSPSPAPSSEVQGSKQTQADAAPSSREEGFHFSTPVQVSEEDSEQIHVLDEGFRSVSFQESSVGDHWTTDGASAAQLAGSPSSTSYREGLVTNRTQLDADPWTTLAQFHQQSTVLQRPGANARQGEGGQLLMRGTNPNPVLIPLFHRHAVEHLNPELPPTDYFPNVDQLNMDGSEDSDHRPRYPHFGFPVMRLVTFQQGWPVNHPQSASSLVDAGFFYAGHGDSVLCYSCGIGVRHWLSTDDPWIEHAHIRPNCFFVGAVQGEHFVQVAREMRRNGQHPTYREVRLEANRRRQTAEAEAGQEIREEAPSDDDPGVELLCKVCYRRERTVMLMPCRHLALCQPCSTHQQSCPVCRTYLHSVLHATFG